MKASKMASPDLGLLVWRGRRALAFAFVVRAIVERVEFGEPGILGRINAPLL
jgi:hypothetical protein